MGLRTPDEYLESLRSQHPDVYARGERVESVVDHPMFASTISCWGTWVFRAAHDPELAPTMVAGPDLNGDQCHVFWHMATSPDDLLQNLWAARLLSERSPLSGYASIGRDEPSTNWRKKSNSSAHPLLASIRPTYTVKGFCNPNF